MTKLDRPDNERVIGLVTALIMRSSVENGEPDGHIDAALARKIASSCTSTWLKNAILASLDRDPVDALHDAEALVRIMSDVCDEVSA